MTTTDTSPTRGSAITSRAVWLLATAALLTVGVLVVVFGWHTSVGPASAPGQQLSSGAVTVNSAVLVFREGLECILVLAAVTASMRGSKANMRRPIAAGGGAALVASVITWFLVVALISAFGGTGLNVQAATGIPAIIVLLIVMNWFLHKIYWTGWISLHNRRRRNVVKGSVDKTARNTMLGLALLGFSSVYREGFEIVIFLQGLRVKYGSGIVCKGLVLGLLFTAAVGVLTFVVHERLPYKKMLIVTGALLVIVLFVMVGEQVNEMQLAGWIGTTPVGHLTVPGWLGTWFSVFPNWETVIAQVLAVGFVVGSYVLAELLKARKRRRPHVTEPVVPPPAGVVPEVAVASSAHDELVSPGAR